MRNLILSTVIALTLNNPVMAQSQAEAPLQRLLEAEDRADWVAVGRINIQGSGFCTGTLIAEDLVLTAAHCLYHHLSHKQVSVDRLHFLAGWQRGEFVAHARAARVAIPAGFQYRDKSQGLLQFIDDIALIELTEAISPDLITPLAPSDDVHLNKALAVVSYAKGRAEAPSLQRPCHRKTSIATLRILTCEVNFGASGAPVIVEHESGLQVAAVISGKSENNAETTAIAVPLGSLLDELLGQLGREFNVRD